jgi:hypothetical protein
MKNFLRATVAILGLLSTQAMAEDDNVFCPDRPGKATSTCVVAPGKFQIESDLYNWTNNGPALFTSPAIKYGIGHGIDIEAAITPYERIGHSYGNGDLYLKIKVHLVKIDGAVPVDMAVLPYIKVPVAPSRQIGNGYVEGGIILPIAFTLPLGFTLSAAPEIDQFHNPTGNGYYSNFQGAISLTYPIFNEVVVGAEFWQLVPLNPNAVSRFQTPQQQSVDFFVSWLITPFIQVDTGINIGTNSATPHEQAYAGISVRF